MSSIRRTEEYCLMRPAGQDSKHSGDQSDHEDEDAPPPLCEDSDSSDDERDDVPPPLCVDSSDDEDGDEPPLMRTDSTNDEGDDEPPPLCVDDQSSDEEDFDTWTKTNRTWKAGELNAFLGSVEARTGKKWESRAPGKGPHQPPFQAAKRGSGNNNYEGEPTSNQAATSVSWEWQHNTAQPKGATLPVEDPKPIAQVKGSDTIPPVKGPEPESSKDDENSDFSWDSERQKLLEEAEMIDLYATSSSSSLVDYYSEPSIDIGSITPTSSQNNYPGWFVDNHLNPEQYSEYTRYLLAGGRRKYRPTDRGDEAHYANWPPITFEEGEWCEDFNNLAPSEWSQTEPYIEWYRSVLPKPTTVREALRNWLDRRQQLKRRRDCTPGTYEAHLQDCKRGVKPRADGRDPDVWDGGALYRTHMIRKQAAMDIAGKASADDGDNSVIYVKEQDVDNHLIWCDRHKNGINEPRPSLLPIHDDISAREARLRTVHSDRDWDFFYRSLSGPSANVPQLLKNSLNIGANPAVKSDIRTLKRAPLSDRIRQTQKGLRKQRMVNAIFDTGAQVTTMPESAVNRMPSAHNHRDAAPGTAVKYGNGEIETIESLVDIGHLEVQVTPDNCSTSLISVDQIVQDGHTVTFSATETIITDDNNRYRLAYPRVLDSREWIAPMRAMEDITRMRAKHPRQIKNN